MQQPDSHSSDAGHRLHFVLEVQPETTHLAWHAWLRGTGAQAPTSVDFDSPMALLRFLAHLHARHPARPGPSGLR